MTYSEIVEALRTTFEYADARRVFEHVAFEIDIEGEGEGALYFEVADRACVIEPYNYFDNDGIFTADGKTLLELASKEIHLKDALEKGRICFRGNQHKLKVCLDNIRLPGVKYD